MRYDSSAHTLQHRFRCSQDVFLKKASACMSCCLQCALGVDRLETKSGARRWSWRDQQQQQKQHIEHLSSQRISGVFKHLNRCSHKQVFEQLGQMRCSNTCLNIS